MKTCFKRIIAAIASLIILVPMLLTVVGCGYSAQASPNIVNNFFGRSHTEFKNINGSDVEVETFYIETFGTINNPNAAIGIMLKQCIDYKIKHPEKRVYASLTTFHLSVVGSVCLDRSSKNFCQMKSLYDREYDDEGYYRISYLLVECAKYGIETYVIGQLNAAYVMQEGGYVNDYSFADYFNAKLEETCYDGEHKVSDFMTFRECKWTSYGDKAASDMMHLKSASVSDYVDYNGNEKKYAVWFGSINLDGINKEGGNGNAGDQTAVVISGHEKIFKVLKNYTKLVSEYCGQEDVYNFRNIVNQKNTEQIDILSHGGQVDEDEQIVYLKSATDSVFELFFTPLGGPNNSYDLSYNPIAKYVNNLLPEISGQDYIVFSWINVKFITNFEFANIISNVLSRSFHENKNKNNRLILRLPGFDYSLFDDLRIGGDIGFKSVYDDGIYHHMKDFQLSYVRGGLRHYVTVFNSLNMHQGSCPYQVNSFLIIDETKFTGNNVFVSHGECTSYNCITDDMAVKQPN